ncbi:hypothetical protein J6U76_08015 [bacterium]|nr:hypothetical protein [bacterium]
MKNIIKISFLFVILSLGYTVSADPISAKIEGPIYLLKDSPARYKVVLEGLDDNYIFRVLWHDVVNAQAVSSGQYLIVKAPSVPSNLTLSCDVDYADPGSTDKLLRSTASYEVLVGGDDGHRKAAAAEVKTNQVEEIYFYRHRMVEKLTVSEWHDMLVEFAKNMGDFKREIELDAMRPPYRLKMNYAALETLTEKDVEAVKLANNGTNKLNWCWNLLKPRDGSYGGPSYLEKQDLAGAWRKTNFKMKPLDLGAHADALRERFFWYVGQAYAKDIWEEWYACFKAEAKKALPRKLVLEKLIQDFSTLEVYLLPYLYDAFEAGDETLARVKWDEDYFYNIFNYDPELSKNYLRTWWKAHKDAYERKLSAEEGLREALKNAEASIKYLETDPREPEILRAWAKEIKEYYETPLKERKKEYWYYVIGDAPVATNEDIWEILSKNED